MPSSILFRTWALTFPAIRCLMSFHAGELLEGEGAIDWMQEGEYPINLKS